MRRQRFAQARERLVQETKTSSFGNIIPLIAQQKVIPIISNSFRIQQIFAEQKEVIDEIPETSVYEDEDLTSDEQITKEWANFIGYPMPDNHSLARVAQYHLVGEVRQKVTSYLARAKYINFMKEFILTVFAEDEEYQGVVTDLKSAVRERSFSDIVSELELPKFPEQVQDPLNLLAKLPLPIYITTSYYDFLERALLEVNKKPITQICFWSGEIKDIRPEHHTDKDFTPSPKNPLVYHLYGLEDYPETMVLSEDDYMNFLVEVMRHTDNLNPIVPSSLREALPESQLLLLGYQLGDWDFRVLFRFLSKFRIGNRKSLERGMVIQLKELSKKEMGDVDKTLEYLREYFDQENFEVKWGNVEDFIRELCKEWNQTWSGEA
jgi:hypothetical protein